MEANPLHSEIEFKFDADHVDVKKFKRWCLSKQPERYLHIVGTDVYWTQGRNVVRHRHGAQDEPGELTVKKRRSSSSTTDRLEVDLEFAPDIETETVERFLDASGWSRYLHLVKDAHIFWFNSEENPYGNLPVSVVIYDVYDLEIHDKDKVAQPEGGRYVEVEIDKQNSHDDSALDVLKEWRTELESRWDFKGPLTESLWEIYTGKKYLKTKKGKA